MAVSKKDSSKSPGLKKGNEPKPVKISKEKIKELAKGESKVSKAEKFLEQPIIIKQGKRSDTTSLGSYGKSMEMMSLGRKKAGDVMKETLLKSNKTPQGYRVLNNKGGMENQEAARYGRTVAKPKKYK